VQQARLQSRIAAGNPADKPGGWSLCDRKNGLLPPLHATTGWSMSRSHGDYFRAMASAFHSRLTRHRFRSCSACPYSKLRKPKKSWSFSGIQSF